MVLAWKAMVRYNPAQVRSLYLPPQTKHTEDWQKGDCTALLKRGLGNTSRGSIPLSSAKNNKQLREGQANWLVAAVLKTVRS